MPKKVLLFLSRVTLWQCSHFFVTPPLNPFLYTTLRICPDGLWQGWRLVVMDRNLGARFAPLGPPSDEGGGQSCKGGQLLTNAAQHHDVVVSLQMTCSRPGDSSWTRGRWRRAAGGRTWGLSFHDKKIPTRCHTFWKDLPNEPKSLIMRISSQREKSNICNYECVTRVEVPMQYPCYINHLLKIHKGISMCLYYIHESWMSVRFGWIIPRILHGYFNLGSCLLILCLA